MRKFSQFLSFVSGPVLLGLVCALFVLLLFPNHFNLPLQKYIHKALDVQQVENLQMASYASAVDKASPSVVNIYTLQQRPSTFNNNLGRYESTRNQVLPTTGSGVIVSDDGYIITNLHVIEWATEIRVALQDGRDAEPHIIGISKEDDMAILKIDLENVQAIDIGNPDTARVGDIVLAIGNPFGVGQTVTQGIISGTRRKGLKISHYENFIQTDAAINPGNSGGALIDTKGRLLGINIGDLRQTYYGDASGIGFAIPADRAIQALADIIEYGRVVRGWLGVTAIDINPQVAKSLNLKRNDGVLITDTYRNGPADIAGLVVGDIITAINNQSVNSMSTAIQEFSDLRPGDILTIDIVRGDQNMQLEAVLSAGPS